MEPDLGPAYGKIYRSVDQQKGLIASLQAFLNNKPFQVTREVDPNALWVFDVVESIKSCPSEWNFIIGEIAHNLRSALDYLVYQLVIHETGAPPTASKTQFPIFENESGFIHRAIPTMLHSVGSAATALIKSEQPFATGEGRKSPLWFLSELSNVDKHKTLCIAGPMGRGTSASGVYPDVEGVFLSVPVLIKQGAKLYGAKLGPSDQPLLERASKVRIDGTFTYFVAFEEPEAVRGIAVDRLLHAIYHRVRRIADRIDAEIIKRKP